MPQTRKTQKEGQRALKITRGGGARLPSAGLLNRLGFQAPHRRMKQPCWVCAQETRADQTQAELAALRTWRVLFLFPQMACPL